VQGQLRREKLSAHIDSECGHCRKALHLDVDSELNYRLQEAEAAPLVFVPLMNLRKLDEPSIIDDF
jgi:hypothetical protein